MGFSLFGRAETAAHVSTGPDAFSERYSVYFPRVFSYVRACVGAELPAEDIVVQSFYRAFERAADGDDERFRTVLFRTARRLCRPALTVSADRDGASLTGREVEALSLVFDAGLSREQISRTFRIKPGTVSALVMSGLRKLKEQTSSAAATAYLNLA